MKLFSLFISNPSRTVKIRVKFRLEATRKLKIKKRKKYPVFGSILKEIGENKMKRNVKGTMEEGKKSFENDFGRHSIYQQRKSNFAGRVVLETLIT